MSRAVSRAVSRGMGGWGGGGFAGILSTRRYIACVEKIVVVVGWRIEVGGGSGGFAGILSTQT